jgi:hypothetical protein
VTGPTHHFAALDFTFSLDGPSALVDPLAHALTDLSVPGPSGAPYAIDESGDLTLAGMAVDDTGSPDLLTRLVRDVDYRASRLSEGVMTVHAGAVVAPGGGALLLPADSGSGKTTLTTALVSRGLGYLSDEFAAIDVRTLDLRPYPKPISLKEGSYALFPALAPYLDDGPISHVPASRVRPGAVVRHPCAAAYIAFPHRAPGERARLTPMSRAETVVELARHGSLAVLGDRVLEVLGGFVRRCDAYRLVFDDLDEVTDLLVELSAP